MGRLSLSAFRDGERVELQSKSGQPLTRYFPELVEALKTLKAERFVIDGEIGISIDGGFSFDALLQRIHPAASRVKKLAEETPAKMIVFDLLAGSDGRPLVALALEKRRALLEAFARSNFSKRRSIELSPATTDVEVARHWLKLAGGALDGIVAKRLDLPYQSGERTGMLKRLRTADCVVRGFRYASKEKIAGSLLLGLYDNRGLLHHVGFTSGFSKEERKNF